MTIKDVAKQYDISADTLRYYEKVGLIGPIKRNGNGIRLFDETVLSQIEFVKCMRDANFPIRSLVTYMKLFEQGDQTVEARRQLLVEQREVVKQQLSDLQKAYDKLNYKIDLYDQQLLETKLKQ